MRITIITEEQTMKIKYYDTEDFHMGCIAMAKAGMMFNAHWASLTIELTGDY